MAGTQASETRTHRFGLADVPVLGTWDTVVVGGGTAGASSAISAAREGNRTLVVERYGSLGGSPVHALVSPMMDARAPHERNLREIERRLNERGVVTREDDDLMGYIWFTPEQLSEVLEDMLVEAGGQALFDATLVAADVIDGAIVAVEVMTVEGPRALLASQFVDATGDAALSRLAGVPCVAGDDDGNNQMCSLRFEMGGIDVEAYRAYCLSLGDEFSPLKQGYFWESAMVAGKGFKLACRSSPSRETAATACWRSRTSCTTSASRFPASRGAWRSTARTCRRSGQTPPRSRARRRSWMGGARPVGS